jgi:hypothetical protein
MQQCIQELETQATLKQAVVEYQATTYVDKHRLEAQPREAGQQQEVRMFETQAKIQAILHAQCREAEMRAHVEEEFQERLRRTDAKAKQIVETERHTIAIMNQQELQYVRAQIMHYEAMVSKAHQEVEEQRRAAEDMQRVARHVDAERQKISLQKDHDAQTLQRSMVEALERQKISLFDESRMQQDREFQVLQQNMAEALDQQKSSLFSEFRERENHMAADNAQLQSHLEKMRSMMFEVQKEITGRRAQVVSQARGEALQRSRTSDSKPQQDPAPAEAYGEEGPLRHLATTSHDRDARTQMRGTSAASKHECSWAYGGRG